MKNYYFQEMLREVIDWGVKPRIVTGDTWYSGVESFKTDILFILSICSFRKNVL